MFTENEVIEFEKEVEKLSNQDDGGNPILQLEKQKNNDDLTP